LVVGKDFEGRRALFLSTAARHNAPSLQDRADFVVTVDGVEVILSVDSATDVEQYTLDFCDKYKLPHAYATELIQAIRTIQPPKYFL
jgi:fumarylacetoacetate (FAA) hydrolase family protein